MKEQRISLTKARQILARLPEQFSNECPSIVITSHNQPLMAIMPYETHQSLLETIESLQTLLKIIGSNKLVETALQKKKEKMCPPGSIPRHLSWEEFQKEVGWE
jgi:PHD/YefM family antitoxin component YafN of YafNO toxin-antitoxin module